MNGPYSMSLSQAKKGHIRNTVYKILLHDQNCLQWSPKVFTNTNKCLICLAQQNSDREGNLL
jgi:hypothetical protein